MTVLLKPRTSCNQNTLETKGEGQILLTYLLSIPLAPGPSSV